MAPALWITAWLSVSLVWPAKEYYARLTLPADQQIDFAQERLRAVIPPHATVMTADAWWLLASDHATFAPGFALIDDVARIDYYVASSNGTGAPGKWIEPLFPRYKAWLRDEFEVVQDDLPKETVSIFGRRISRSAYGFGAIVLRRRAALVSTSADSLGNESRQPRLERMSRAKIQ